MSEQPSFEARAVLGPRHPGRNRLALLLPAVALVAIAWAGSTGARSDPATVRAPDPTLDAAPSSTPLTLANAVAPLQVIGLRVQQLAEVRTQTLGRDDVIAVAGWYVATAISDCPPLAAIYRQGALPDVRGDADASAFCVRSGVLYAAQPDAQHRGSVSVGPPSVEVTIVVGVVMPPELELVGADATEVVVVGRIVRFTDGCPVPAVCPPELLVDHVAWTHGA